MTTNQQVIIVGGGLGGLAAAVTLARRGVPVHIFEQNGHWGGKMMPWSHGPFYFDFGPNTLLMPHVFKQVLKEDKQAGTTVGLSWKKIVRHTWQRFPDGTQFYFSADQREMLEQVLKLENGSTKGYRRLLSLAERFYRLSERHFWQRPFFGVSDYADPQLICPLVQVKPWRSLAGVIDRYLAHPRLREAFYRYATYVGGSPWQTPAVLASVIWAELSDGVYFIEEGNAALAQALAREAEQLGARLHLGVRVKALIDEGRHIKGVVLDSGDRVEAHTVIINGDRFETGKRLLMEEDKPYPMPSLSAMVGFIGLRLTENLVEKAHHELLYGRNYRREFEQLLAGETPDDPTVYICRHPRGQTAEGESWLVLVNAPPLSEKQRTESEVAWLNREKEKYAHYKSRVWEKLQSFGYHLIPRLRFEHWIDPIDLYARFGAYRGAIYGGSTHGFRGTFLKPVNRANGRKNVYFVGGTVHPGGGSPLAVLSGRQVGLHVAQTIMEDGR